MHRLNVKRDPVSWEPQAPSPDPLISWPMPIVLALVVCGGVALGLVAAMVGIFAIAYQW